MPAEVAFNLQHQGPESAGGIVRPVRQELLDRRIDAGRGLARADGADDGQPRIQTAFRNDEPFGPLGAGRSRPMMALADHEEEIGPLLGWRIRRQRLGRCRAIETGDEDIEQRGADIEDQQGCGEPHRPVGVRHGGRESRTLRVDERQVDVVGRKRPRPQADYSGDAAERQGDHKPVLDEPHACVMTRVRPRPRARSRERTQMRDRPWSTRIPTLSPGRATR